MTAFTNVIRCIDGSYVITQDDMPYHVPNSGDFVELWGAVHQYALDSPEKVTLEAVEPDTPMTVEEASADKYAEIINKSNSVMAHARKKYSEIEIGTWEEQEVGAITILGLPVTSATKTETAYMLENQIAKDRSVARVTQLAADKHTTPEALAQRIMVNAQEARRLIDLIWQKQSGYEEALKVAEIVKEGETPEDAISRIFDITVEYSLPEEGV